MRFCFPQWFHSWFHFAAFLNYCFVIF
jgi:hypothetical protein